jgi:PHD finger-like domain-containing protein 5A
MSKHHPDLVLCRKQPGVAVGRLCERCEGKCVVCDSLVRQTTAARVCDECNYGSFQGKCVICGGVGVSDAFYCHECTVLERDRDGCPKVGKCCGRKWRLLLPGITIDVHHLCWLQIADLFFYCSHTPPSLCSQLGNVQDRFVLREKEVRQVALRCSAVRRAAAAAKRSNKKQAVLDISVRLFRARDHHAGAAGHDAPRVVRAVFAEEDAASERQQVRIVRRVD